MAWLIDFLVPLTAMAALLVASVFFSAAEAALFYLGPRDRREFAAGNRAQRTAAHLLADPERLLSGVLFCNLLVNTSNAGRGGLLIRRCWIRLVFSGSGSECVARRTI